MVDVLNAKRKKEIYYVKMDIIKNKNVVTKRY